MAHAVSYATIQSRASHRDYNRVLNLIGGGIKRSTSHTIHTSIAYAGHKNTVLKSLEKDVGQRQCDLSPQ